MPPLPPLAVAIDSLCRVFLPALFCNHTGLPSQKSLRRLISMFQQIKSVVCQGGIRCPKLVVLQDRSCGIIPPMLRPTQTPYAKGKAQLQSLTGLDMIGYYPIPAQSSNRDSARHCMLCSHPPQPHSQSLPLAISLTHRLNDLLAKHICHPGRDHDPRTIGNDPNED